MEMQFVGGLDEDEQALLFLIIAKHLSVLNIEPRYEFIKFLRKDVAARELELMKRDLLDDKKIVAENLQKKLLS
jgi:hypothetical protein